MIKPKRTFSQSSRPVNISRPSSLVSRQKESITPINSDPKSQLFQIGSYKASKSDLLGQGFCSKVYKAVNEKTGKK